MKQFLITFLTNTLMIIASLAVRVYTGIRSLFTGKSLSIGGSAMACKYHDYPLPTPNQAMNAGAGLARMAFSAAERDLGCAVDCATTIIRYAGSVVAPDDHPPLMESSVVTLSKEEVWKKLGNELKCCESPVVEGSDPSSAAKQTMQGINWNLVLALAQMLLDFLKSRA